MENLQFDPIALRSGVCRSINGNISLRHALAFALRKVHVGAKRLKLDEDTRWQLAGEAIDELRRYGGWKELDEKAPIKMAAKNDNDKREEWKGKPD